MQVIYKFDYPERTVVWTTMQGVTLVKVNCIYTGDSSRESFLDDLKQKQKYQKKQILVEWKSYCSFQRRNAVIL